MLHFLYLVLVHVAGGLLVWLIVKWLGKNEE